MTYLALPDATIPIVKPYALAGDRLPRYVEALQEIDRRGRYRTAHGWAEQAGSLIATTLELADGWSVYPLRSGTDALACCMLLAGVEPGDGVAMPDLAFHAVGSACLQLGGRPVWIDVDPVSWNMSPGALEWVLAHEAGVRAVVAVDNYGTPCAWPELSAVCQRYGVPLILDCCESIGVGHPAGSVDHFADLACLSFNFTKPVHAAGMGGALCAPDRLIARAQDMAKLLLYQRRLPELNAAYLVLSWPDLPRVFAHLAAIYDRYHELLVDLGLTPQQSLATSSRMHAPFLLPGEGAHARDRLIRETGAAGIELRPYFRAQHQVFQTGDGAPVATGVADRVVCLPTGASMPLSQTALVVDAVREALERSRRERARQ